MRFQPSIIDGMLERALQSLDLATLQTERASCLSALLKLARGEKAQRTAFDGRSLDYTPADQPNLERLIAALDSAIQAKTSGRAARRPLHPVY